MAFRNDRLRDYVGSGQKGFSLAMLHESPFANSMVIVWFVAGLKCWLVFAFYQRSVS